MKTMAPTKWLIALTLVGILAVVGSRQSREKSKEEAFRRFFSAPPGSASYVNHGSERSVFGDGSYVLIFKLSETELRSLLEREGYEAIPIDSDSEHSTLDLCNSVVKRLTKSNFQIHPSFNCYSQETEKTRTRLYYDKSQLLVMVVGFGKFAK